MRPCFDGIGDPVQQVASGVSRYIAPGGKGRISSEGGLINLEGSTCRHHAERGIVDGRRVGEVLAAARLRLPVDVMP